MEEITIVRKRSRLWPILIALIVLAAIVLAALWLMGREPAADFGWNGFIEIGRRIQSGTT
jgi:hypothetical protein